jgi:hypothetical protein
MGVKRTLRDHPKSVATDPSRHFTTINYRSAKSSFALMGIPGQPRSLAGHEHGRHPLDIKDKLL